MANSEKPGPKKRRSYEELDWQSQFNQTARLIQDHPEEAAERAANWNTFIAEHPDFANVPMTFDAVKEWAKKEKVDLPYASTIMRDRDIAGMLAADKARAEGTWVARTKKAKPEVAPAEAATTAASPEPTAAEEVAPKQRRKKRELTTEEKEDAALAADYGLSYNYRRKPVLGERLPLAGAPKQPSYDVALPPLFNREHWHANHAKSEAYKEKKKRETATKLVAEGYFEGLPKPGDRDFVPESPAEFTAHTQALLDSSQEITESDTARATIPDMEVPPKPKIVKDLEEGSEQIGNIQHDDPGFETGPEGPDAVVDVGDAESLEETDAVAAPELDLTKVADANVAFEEEEESIAATPAEAPPAAAPDFIVPQEAVDIHNAEKGMPPVVTGENNSLTDETPVVGEDIPHIEAAKNAAERSEEVVEKSGFKEWEKDWIRNWGRKYNDMSKTKKIILGATLGATAAAGIAFGSPIALAAGLFGTSLQRISGGLGMFVHAENYMLGENAKKERGDGWFEDSGRQWKTAGAALAYAGLATFGIKKAIDYTADWLGHMWPGDAADGIHGQPVSEIADKLPTAPEAPGVTVEATQGKGYEYMAKRLWEQLHGADSSLVDQDFITQHPESDAAKLWNAPADKIDAVVHQIATERGFYQPDAENVLIKPDSVLGFTPDGSLRLGVPGGSEVIDAAPDAPVTPPYSPEVSAPEAAPEVAPVDTGADHAGSIDSHSDVAGPESSAPDHSFINKHGIEVFDSQPNLYTDGSGKELYVYGGDAGQKAGFIEKFYSNPQNADKVIYSSDQAGETRVAWRLTNGQLTPSAVPKTRILGFGRGFEKAPSPDDLRMLIK